MTPELTYSDGIAIARQWHLEEEFKRSYENLAFDAWENRIKEDDIVRMALKEWDLL